MPLRMLSVPKVNPPKLLLLTVRVVENVVETVTTDVVAALLDMAPLLLKGSEAVLKRRIVGT